MRYEIIQWGIIDSNLDFFIQKAIKAKLSIQFPSVDLCKYYEEKVDFL